MSTLKTLAAAALAGFVGVAAVGSGPALAQYNDDPYDDRDYDRADNRQYDDGSYPSDQRGGYRDDDDEDGYEDGQDAPDVSYFYDELEDEGTWISHPDYGQVWRPRGIDDEWRPYTRGTWANSEEHGWYWVSDEPFGWATYHYGRWHLDDRYGWVWVPGTRWGPAWVAWRESDEQIGWAPLPPDAYWEHGSGLRFSETIYEGPRFSAYWSFIEPRYITSPRIYTYCAPRARVINYITITRPRTNYVFVNRRIVNRGVSVTTIERVTRTRITTVRINQTDNRTYRTIRRDDRTINVYRPRLTRVGVVRPANKNRPAIDRTRFKDVDRRPVRVIAPGRPDGTTGPVGLPVDRGIAPAAPRNPDRGLTNQERERNQRIRERQRDVDDDHRRPPVQTGVFPQQGRQTGPAGLPVDNYVPPQKVKPRPQNEVRRPVRDRPERVERAQPRNVNRADDAPRQRPRKPPPKNQGGDALQERAQRSGPQGLPQ